MVRLDYKLSFALKPKIDLRELAKLRESGLSLRGIEKLMPIAFSVVMGLVVTHPRTWRVELAKLQYSILREAIRTDNWGDPNIAFHQGRTQHLKRY